MSDQKKSSKLGLGVLIGTIIGGITALFLSPNTGEENRKIAGEKIKELEDLLKEKEIDKKVKEIFGNVTHEAEELFIKTKKAVIKELAVLKDKLEDVDKGKYVKIVEKVITDLKKNPNHSLKDLEKLRDYLVGDWKKIVEHKERKSKKS